MWLLVLVTAIVSLFIGVALTLAAEWYLLSTHEKEKEKFDARREPSEISKAVMPDKVIESARGLMTGLNKEIDDVGLAVNLLAQFFFQEVRFKGAVRRLLIEKINQEMDEAVSKVRGKIIESIKIHDMGLGPQAPVIKSIKVTNVEMDLETHQLKLLDLFLDLEYEGGYEMAIDAALAYGRSAFLSIKVGRIAGEARLRFCRYPFSHWSFAFSRAPEVDLDIKSEFQGRSLSQVTSLIATQVRRLLQRKHTLPSYKIRFAPFFESPDKILYEVGRKATKVMPGRLQITILQCSRLNRALLKTHIYGAMALDDMAWIMLSPSKRPGYLVMELKVSRDLSQPFGLLFYAEDNTLLPSLGGLVGEAPESKDRQTVVVDRVSSGSPAHAAGLKPGDKILQVAGTSVRTVDEATRAVMLAGARFNLVIQRLCVRDPHLKNHTQSNPVVVTAATTETTLHVPSTDTFPASDIGKGIVVEDVPRQSVRVGEPVSEIPDFLHASTSSDSSTDALKSSYISEEAQDALAFDDLKKDPQLDNADTTLAQQVPVAANSVAANHAERKGEAIGVDVRHTLLYPSSENPILHDLQLLEVAEHHTYLNLSLWSTDVKIQIPNLSSLGDVMRLNDTDACLGYVCLPLSEIVADCVTNSRGRHVAAFKLAPADADASEGQKDPLSTQPGFDPRLCYGDVLLSFQYRASGYADLGPSSDMDTANFLAEPGIIHKDVKAAIGTQEAKAVISDGVEKREHDFIHAYVTGSRNCTFCHKKIWLKEAAQCRVCGMICHKKCVSQCQKLTTCSIEGFSTKPLAAGMVKPSKMEPEVEEGVIGDTIKKIELVLPSDAGELKVKNAPKSPRRGLGAFLNSIKEPNSLRRAGSVHNLASPSGSKSHAEDLFLGASLSSSSKGILTSRSLPPSPKQSPTNSNKTFLEDNPFLPNEDEEVDELAAAVDRLLARPNDESLVSLAKETGKQLYNHLAIPERREKISRMVSHLQMAVEAETVKRAELAAKVEQEYIHLEERKRWEAEMGGCEERRQALALLLLHYCAGLQYLEELEQALKVEAQKMVHEDQQGSILI